MMHELRELPNGQLRVFSYDIRMNKMNKIERVPIHTLVSADEDEIYDYMISMGVKADDLEYAFNAFDEFGDNVASFGVGGGLTHTMFQGTLH